MMKKDSIQIVIIDDDLEMKTRPLYEELVDTYGDDAVIWKDRPKSGLQFVTENLEKKTIIILDYNFGNPKFNGLNVFQELQKKSSLLYVILHTAKSIDEIPDSDIKAFINDHLMAFIDKASGGYKKVLLEIDKAINYLNNRIDSVLEEWIIQHKFFTSEEPVMKNKDGQFILLRDVLTEIRKDSDFGRDVKSNIIGLAISLMRSKGL